MAIINGTNGADKLIGTDGDDIITSYGIYGYQSPIGKRDILVGNGGADTYVLSTKTDGYSTTRHSYVIDERGGDASVDTITGLGSLIQTASLGYIAYSTFQRVGDNLIITTPPRPSRFRKPGIEGTDIKIVDQYDDLNPNAQVELFQAGGTTYNLVVGGTGTAGADIMAGANSIAEVFYAGDGNDFIYGNGRSDYLYGEGGDDYIFGGTGSDRIYGGAGVDHLFGEDGNDRIYGEDGNDIITGGAGNDRIKAGNGNDTIEGNDGRDKIWGNNGDDILIGGTGNDYLIGGRGSDIYVFNNDDLSSDIVNDSGSKLGSDTIVLSGTADIRGVDFSIFINNILIDYNNGLNHIFVNKHFAGTKYAIESIYLGSDYNSVSYNNVYHISNLKGDQFKLNTNGSPVDTNTNDIVFGTDGNDVIYGGLGIDVLIGGAGADTFLMQDEGAYPGSEQIRDFTIGEDLIDLSEIKAMTFADLSIVNNEFGNAHVTSIAGAPAAVDFELFGIDAASVNESLFIFNNTLAPNPTPTPTPTPGVDGVIYDTAGDTILKGTDANDVFTFLADTAFTGSNTVKDFISGSDSIDISDLISGYDPLTSAISDYVQITENAAEAIVTLSVDTDGAGTNAGFQTVTTIADVTAADITDGSLLLV